MYSKITKIMLTTCGRSYTSAAQMTLGFIFLLHQDMESRPPFQVSARAVLNGNSHCMMVHLQ